MIFYADILDGEVTVMTTFGESSMETPPEMDQLVFNSEVRSGDLVLKASDDPQHENTTPSISLFVEFDVASQRQVVFDRLADGGEVVFPIDGPFAMVADRYGTRWMLIADA